MPPTVAAAILAGGAGRRLGGVDKALIPLGDRRLIDHVSKALTAQTSYRVLCCRAAAPWTADLGFAVVEDLPAPGRGPLGGIAAALVWAAAHTAPVDWVVTAPVDVPFLPPDLVKRLTATDADTVVAASAGQVHHTVAAWRPALAKRLLQAIASEAMAVHRFQSMIDTAEVEWPVIDIDPFMNINTPEDLVRAEQVVTAKAHERR